MHNTYAVIIYGDYIFTTVTCDLTIAAQWITEVETVHRRCINLNQLDVEWRPSFNRYSSNPAVTLQLCVGRRCLIFQLIHSTSVPPALVNFIVKPSYPFVRIEIRHDLEKLGENYEFRFNMKTVDLRELAAEKYGRWDLKNSGDSPSDIQRRKVNKFKEIGNDVSVDGPISDLCNGYIDVEQKLEETSGYGSQSSSQPKVVEAVAELEDIFKQKIEAEVEYLAISRMVQELRIAAVDQISVLEQTKVLDKLGDNENKAAALEKQADKLENFCEEIANANKILKLKKDAYMHGSCFVMQFALLFVVLCFFIH